MRGIWCGHRSSLYAASCSAYGSYKNLLMNLSPRSGLTKMEHSEGCARALINEQTAENAWQQQVVGRVLQTHESKILSLEGSRTASHALIPKKRYAKGESVYISKYTSIRNEETSIKRLAIMASYANALAHYILRGICRLPPHIEDHCYNFSKILAVDFQYI